MEEKASDLDAENKMLRQAVASIPAIKSPSSEIQKEPDLQVPRNTEGSIYNHDDQCTKLCCAC